jgi:dimeric dUTPase (all-alpha-NTP-PPase superfamily)
MRRIEMKLDFPRLFETQRQFDKRLVPLKVEDGIKKKFVACLTEMGEAINEFPQVMKYWSSNKKGATQKNIEYFAKVYDKEPIEIEGDPLLEELADNLHFIISLGNDLHINSNELKITLPKEENTLDLLLEFFTLLTSLYSLWNVRHQEIFKGILTPNTISKTYKELLNVYFGITNSLGYSDDKIVDAYYKKDEKNHERQENGY